MTQPTTDRIMANAFAALVHASAQLSEARAWMQSDPRDGQEWTVEQVNDRQRIAAAIREAKAAIEKATHRRES